jgi:fibronectin-binding autotransporter adhesin
MTPKTLSRLLSLGLLGCAVATAPTARAVDTFWKVGTGDFMNPANWNRGGADGLPVVGDYAFINNGGTAQFSSPAHTLSGMRIGRGGSGALELSGGGVFTVNDSTHVGRDNGGNGALVLSGSGTIYRNGTGVLIVGMGNTGGSSQGVLTVNQGASLEHGTNLFIIGDGFNPGVYTGTVNLHGGTITSRGEFWVGQNGGTGFGDGFLNITSGTLNVEHWLVLGRAGATGTLNMTGGVINRTGLDTRHTVVGAFNYGYGELNISGDSLINLANGGLFIGDGGVGTVNQSSGTVQVTVGEVWIGQNSVGDGQYNLSGGSITANNWFVIGRAGATGKLNMTGGTITKGGSAATAFEVGTFGNNVNGTFDQSAGEVNVTGRLNIGNNNNALGVVTLSGSAEFTTSAGVAIARESASANGTLNLDGGRLTAPRISGDWDGSANTGVSTVNFNGGVLRASQSSPNFIGNLTAANLNSGGMVVDTQGFVVASAQFFSGSGGITKRGSGSFALTGPSNFSGPTQVEAGTLSVSTASIGGGSYAVANGAGLGVKLHADGAQLNASALTLGGGPLHFDLGSFGSPSQAPLKVNGSLQVNGTVTVTVATSLPQVGQFPLLSYASRSGTGSFVLGELQGGMEAVLVDNLANGTIDLNITRASLLQWSGSVSGAWDIDTTANWTDLISGSAAKFLEGDPVVFNDQASGSTDVVVSQAVSPGELTFNHSSRDYSLSGAGKVSGSVGLLKQGSGTLTVSANNDYTGPTRIEGGILSISSVADAGAASPLGAASASSSNLSLAGGVLRYTGPDAASSRGFHLDPGANQILTESVLTLSGPVTAQLGSQLHVNGSGTLKLSHPGSNVLARGPVPTVQVGKGTLALEGGNAQTNTIEGDLQVGNQLDAGGHLVLDGTSLALSGFLVLGQGNGSDNHRSTVSILGSSVSAGGLAIGYHGNPEVVGYLARQEFTLSNSTFNNSGITNVGESGGTTTTFLVDGESTLTSANRMLIGMMAGSSGSVTLAGNSSTTVGNWMSVGVSGQASLVVKESARLTAPGDFNITDLVDSQATLTIQDNATLSVGSTWVGKDVGTVGVVNQSGGVFTGGVGGAGVFQIGSRGLGTWNLSNGTVNAAGWVAVGRHDTGAGLLNVTGGAFNQTGAGNALLIGEEGEGTINVSGSGAVSSVGSFGLAMGWAAVGKGTVNLNGGSITTTRVQKGAGQATFNFNGGVLRAVASPNANFMSGLTAANVLAGGAQIDTQASSITVAQPLLDGGGNGGLTKSGSGTLTLSGANTYKGPTVVSAGTLVINGDQSAATGSVSVPAGRTLSGNGIIGGSVTVAGTLTPGPAIGALQVNGAISFSAGSILTLDINEAAAGINDSLVALGALNIDGAVLQVAELSSLTKPAYIIARYGSLAGTTKKFATAGLPAGYKLNYAYNDGVSSNNIALVLDSGASPFEAWMGVFFPGVTDPAIVGPAADPDGDGRSNLIEFALGGDPSDSSDRGLMEVFSHNGEMHLTLAVLKGAPVFAGSPAPSSTVDGITYRIEGSFDLSDYTAPVVPTAPQVFALPALEPNSEYEYRTFRLDSSGTNRGFLRVRVTAL